MKKFIKVTTEIGAELIKVENIDSVRFIKGKSRNVLVIIFDAIKSPLKVLETIDEIYELLNEK